jgi:tetratricopeptide (TPR) repeat protein
LQLNPPLAAFVHEVKPIESRAISTLARWHALPESYLYGLVDVRSLAGWYPTYAFGKVYTNGVWFYFPAAFAIKSTLAFLALLLLAAAAIATRRLSCWREILFLTVPPAFYLAVAMSSGLNIGVRHILPLYVFLSTLAAGAAWALIRSNRRWMYAVAALLLFHAVSSARRFPTYLAYANELWGGPSNTYKYLTDSNTDWAQQLKSVKKYLDSRGVKQCWFAYFAGGVVDPARYGIPCQTLPTVSSVWLHEPSDVPPVIDGPVLVSAGTLSGFESGPGALNPYDQFQRLQPTAVIDHGVFVFDGRFNVPLASAWSRTQQAWGLLGARQPQRALEAAQAAVAADPDEVRAQVALGDVLSALGRRAEARPAYEKALALARSVEPEFQGRWLATLPTKLARQ